MDPKLIATITENISKESETLVRLLRNPKPHCLTNGVNTSGGDPVSETEVARVRVKLLGHMERLDHVLRGPANFLHQIIGFNWDKGALYTLIQNNVIQHLPHTGNIALAALAEKTSISAEKLLPILRLAVCHDIVQEPEDGHFQHGSVSKQLIDDPGLMAFIGFQLYETRVASVHLADSLRKPNPFWTGQSAFEYAWGEPMYDWHKSHPQKGERFKAAMKSVTEAMDPGKSLLQNWFDETVSEHSTSRFTFTDVTRFPTGDAHFLSELYPSGVFQELELTGLDVRKPEQRAIDRTSIYYLNSVLWNLPDESCIQLLKEFVLLLKKSPNSILLINDLLSPLPGRFDPHLEKAYRRRDVTVMAMHNAKLRTQMEWQDIFLASDQSFKVSNGEALQYCTGIRTNHSLRRCRSSSQRVILHIAVVDCGSSIFIIQTLRGSEARFELGVRAKGVYGLVKLGSSS